MGERADDIIFLGEADWDQVAELLPAVRVHTPPAGEPEELLAWADDRDLGGAIVVGHGPGCADAQLLAAERPDLVAGLVLAGSGRPLTVLDRARGRKPLVPERELAERELPTVVVWGDRDDLGLARRLADALHADYDLVEEGSRNLPEEHPGRVAQAIGRVAAATRTATAAAARPALHQAGSSSRSAPRRRRARRPG